MTAPFIAAFALMLAASCTAEAQQPQQRPAGRAQLEAEVRRQFARVVQQRVGLTDEQMTRLAPIVQRHALERRRLQTEERETRMSLQRAMRQPRDADTTQVAQLLQKLVDMQKRRAVLLEQEQRELAPVMSPIQRARFMALQEQVRRQVEQRRGSPPGAAPRRRPPA